MPGPVCIQKLWDDPRSGRHFAILDDGRISAGLDLLPGWRYGTARERARCVVCDEGTTRVRDPEDRPRHPACTDTETP